MKLELSLIFIVSILLSPNAAFAYIDPGTGSIVLQAILGGIAGIVVFCKMYWRRIFKGPACKEQNPDENK